MIEGRHGLTRTLPLAARYTGQWNAVVVPPPRFAGHSARLTCLLTARGRDPSSVHRSLMTGLGFGRTDAEVQARLRDRRPEDLLARGVVIGTPGAVVEQLGRLVEALAHAVL